MCVCLTGRRISGDSPISHRPPFSSWDTGRLVKAVMQQTLIYRLIRVVVQQILIYVKEVHGVGRIRFIFCLRTKKN